MAEVNHFYTEGNTGKTTTSQTFIAVDATDGQIDGTSLTANTKYLIVARAMFGSNSLTAKCNLQVSTADDTSIASKSWAKMEAQLAGGATNTVLKSYLFVHSYTTDATPADVLFEFMVDATSTVTVDQYSLLLIDLDDLGSANYVEDINAATGTEYTTTLATQASIAGADLGTTDEWVALGCIKTGIGSTGVNFNVNLRGADDSASQSNLNFVTEEGEDTSEERLVGMVGRHKAVTSNVDLAIEASEDANNGNMTFEGSYLIALKASAFADFGHDYDDTVISLTTTEQTVGTVGPYTPTTNGNHLILGRIAKSGPDNDNIFLHLEDGTTETRTGDSTPSHLQIWDSAKDKEAAYTMQRIDISAQKTYNLRGTGSSNTDAIDAWLLVLNLNLASTGTDDTATLTTVPVTAGIPTVVATGEVNATATVSAVPVAIGTPAVVAAAQTDDTATLSAVPVTVGIPAVTAVGVSDATATLTSVPVTIGIPAVVAVGEVNATATLSTIPVTSGVPAVTATSGATASLTAVPVTAAVPAVTGTATVTLSTVPVTVGIPTVVATGEVNDTATLTAVPVTVGAPAVSVVNDVNATATTTTVPATIGIPAVAVLGEVNATATLSTVPVTVGIPAVVATGQGDAVATLTAVAVAIGIPAVTGSASVTLSVVAVVSGVPSVSAASGATATLSSVPVTVGIPGVDATGEVNAPATLSTVGVTVGIPTVAVTGQVNDTATLTAVPVTTGIPATAQTVDTTTSVSSVQVAAGVPLVSISAGSTVALGAFEVTIGIPTATGIVFFATTKGFVTLSDSGVGGVAMTDSKAGGLVLTDSLAGVVTLVDA